MRQSIFSFLSDNLPPSLTILRCLSRHTPLTISSYPMISLHTQQISRHTPPPSRHTRPERVSGLLRLRSQ